MSDHAVELIAILFGSNGLWILLNNIYQNYRSKKKKNPVEDMVLALVRDKLLTLSKKYLKMEGIPEDEMTNFKKLYEAYISDNGNTDVKELGERALKLPIIFEED